MPPNAQALAAGVFLAGTAAAAYYANSKEQRRQQDLEEEKQRLAEEVKRQREKFQQARRQTSRTRAGADDLLGKIRQRHSTLFGRELEVLVEELTAAELGQGPLRQLLLLGGPAPPLFILFAVLLLWGDAALFFDHAPHEAPFLFGFAVQTISGSQLRILLRWLKRLSALPLLPKSEDMNSTSVEISRDEEDRLLNLIICEEPACMGPTIPSSGVATYKRLVEKHLGFTQQHGGDYVQGDSGRLEFHTKLPCQYGWEAVREVKSYMWWHNLVELPIAWGKWDSGFIREELGALRDCKIKQQPGIGRLQAREDFFVAAQLRRQAAEVLRRLADVGISEDATDRDIEDSWLDLEWCSALSSAEACPPLPDFIAMSRHKDLDLLRDKRLSKSLKQMLQHQVLPPADMNKVAGRLAVRQEVESFVPQYVKLLVTSYFQTNRLPRSASMLPPGSFPCDAVQKDSESVFNVAMARILKQPAGMPLHLQNALHQIQEDRDAEHDEQHRAPRDWVALLILVAIGASIVFFFLFLAMVQHFVDSWVGLPCIVASCLISSAWLGQIKVHKHNTKNGGILLASVLCVSGVTRFALGPGVTGFVLAAIVTWQFAVMAWRCLPDGFSALSYRWIALRRNWTLPETRDVQALRQRCLCQVDQWQRRALAAKFQAHIRRGRISALEGRAFMEALADLDSRSGQPSTAEGDSVQGIVAFVLPGTLEEAESFLNLPLEAESQGEPCGCQPGLTDLAGAVEGALQDAAWAQVDRLAGFTDPSTDSDEEGGSGGVELEWDEEEPLPAALPIDDSKGPSEAAAGRKPRTLKEALEKGGWHFKRRRKHMIYWRVVKTSEGKFQKQTVSMESSPSDVRHEHNAKARLRKLDDFERCQVVPSPATRRTGKRRSDFEHS